MFKKRFVSNLSAADYILNANTALATNDPLYKGLEAFRDNVKARAGALFLASVYEGIRKVVTSDRFEGMVKKLHDSANLQALSFNWWQGERLSGSGCSSCIYLDFLP